MFGQVFTPKIESDKHALKETKLKVTTSESTKDSVDKRKDVFFTICFIYIFLYFTPVQ
jgi:hypothetical protein